MVPLEHVIGLSALLFAIGVAGVALRRNLIVVLMSIELMLNGANLAFLAASRQHSAGGERELGGVVFAVFVIVVAAVEAAVGLALVIALFRLKRRATVEALTPGES
jgi:NADH-quinone oxidoreductase subunit K